MQSRVTLILAVGTGLVLSSCGGGKGGGNSGPAPLGTPCTNGADCASSFCNTGVCSQCGGDQDCGAGGTCADDRAGGGYFVCQSGSTPGLLGDACTVGGDCMSGVCNGNVCSVCGGAGDCSGTENCALGTDNYYLCVNNLSALGDACVSPSECASSFCTDGVCSECGAGADCPGAQECVADAAAGYSVCQGGPGALGESCSDGAECASGFCTGDVCSECGDDPDCGNMAQCVDDTAGAGYFVCESTGSGGALGDACNGGPDCVSGFCAGNVCSECTRDRDCVDAGGPAGSTCVDDTAGVGYFVCDDGLADLGEACRQDAECSSGQCFTGSILAGRCSECKVDTDCLAGQDCNFDAGDGYASCVGTVPLGDPCTLDGQCASGVCNGNVCSECRGDSDCDGGGTCTDSGAFFTCEGGLGESCTTGGDCNSGTCYPFTNTCSECANDMGCAAGQRCRYRLRLGYAVCEGTVALGGSCMDRLACVSGFCNGGLCSVCETNADCPDGNCVDDTAGRGYFICERGLGSNCQGDIDCASGYCYNGFDLRGRVCSECGTNLDCGPGRDCNFDMSVGYAHCMGTVALGNPCNDATQCASGFCTNNVCSECTGGGDCGGGGNCVFSVANGYHVCEGGLGEACMDGSDCASGYCYTGLDFRARVCSECSVNGDCSGGPCAYSLADGYALCM